MKKVILDTSVYGRLVEEPEIASIIFEKCIKEKSSGTCCFPSTGQNSLSALRISGPGSAER